VEIVVNKDSIANFYKGKRVLITGHTGFKGAWLLAVLSQFGANVKGYALEPEVDVCIYNKINGNSLCENIIGDICDKDLFEKEIIKFKPEIIFHLAAQAIVIESYNNPYATFLTNINGTINLLESCKKLENNCSVVVITTDKVYRNLESGHFFTEEDPLGGHDPYSTSKACAELVCQSYQKSYFFSVGPYPQIKLVTARAGNVIGGGDFSKYRLIPDIIKSINNNEELIIRNPNSIRPWQHVLEPVFGYLKLAFNMVSDKSFYAQSYNFGPEKEDHLTVEDLVKQIIGRINKGSYKIVSNDKQIHEAQFLNLDISKAKKELFWKPVFTTEQAIEKAIEWYLAKNKKECTLLQINNYINAI
jgi:CDP-glucose 4,6-dehydratase